MTQDERLIELEQIIRRDGKTTLDFICQRYQISYDSARRDLVKLGNRPGILRIRGGAVLNNTQRHLSFTQRSVPDAVKLRLATFAAGLVQSNDIIFLDAGTTNTLLASCLNLPVSVITNSVESLGALAGRDCVRKNLLGGTFDDFSHAILGSVTIEQIKKYQANRAFIGVSALATCGITAATEMDANLKLAMAQQAQQVIIIVPASKFNTQLMYQSCCWQDIDCMITDITPPEDILRELTRHDVELRIVEQ